MKDDKQDNRPFDAAAEIGMQWDDDEGPSIEENLQTVIDELESAIAALKRTSTRAPIYAMVEAAKHVWNASQILPPLDKYGNSVPHSEAERKTIIVQRLKDFIIESSGTLNKPEAEIEGYIRDYLKEA
jgi:hypothetical protein